MKIVLLALSLLVTITISSQTQQGIVKTRGRMVNGVLQPGIGLQGATVQVKDRAAVISRANGQFSFPLRTNTYVLQNVKKTGYRLVDMEACRSYQYSSNPIFLVMETPEQQRSDQLAAERKIRRNLQRQLEEKEEQIEALQASQQEKDSLLRILYQQQGDDEKLISDMVKRYATLDYDQLDEFYRRVSCLIENGELTRADSLLRTRGDINVQVQGILRQGQAIQEQEARLQQAKAVHRTDIEEVAQRCYSYYETFFAQHQNDSAAYFLELRAELDTTNVSWQNEVGEFVEVYMADYEKAMDYYKSALQQAVKQQGEQGDLVAESYICIGCLYSTLGKYEKALDFFQMALKNRENMPDVEQVDIAECYNNIGHVYSEQGKYALALEMHQKALAIWKNIYGDNHLNVAKSYGNIGIVYFGRNNYSKAFYYLKKALVVTERVVGSEHPELALSFFNIGGMYNAQGNYVEALKYFQKALSIQMKVFGLEHPEVALTYNGIGSVYESQGNYEQALEFYQRALAIHVKVYGERHPEIVQLYYSIGSVCEKLGDQKNALEYKNKAWNLYTDFHKEVLPFYEKSIIGKYSIKDIINSADQLFSIFFFPKFFIYKLLLFYCIVFIVIIGT